jgi:hypothetical protein
MVSGIYRFHLGEISKIFSVSNASVCIAPISRTPWFCIWFSAAGIKVNERKIDTSDTSSLLPQRAYNVLRGTLSLVWPKPFDDIDVPDDFVLPEGLTIDDDW